MPLYTQENRMVAIDSPLGKDVLLLRSFKGREGLSGLFSFELDLMSEIHGIPFEEIIGKPVTITVVLADGGERYFSGIVSRFSQGRGGGETGGSDTRFSYYAATMVPWLWLLTRTADSRIFQNLSAPDIVETIFTEKGFRDYSVRLNGSYETRTYCVQYRETDFNFISRLLEEEGIHYFFEHEYGVHRLVLADAPDKNKPCLGQEIAAYHTSHGGWMEEDVLTQLEVVQEIRPGKYALSDYNFETPSGNLLVDASAKTMLGPGEREIYDYPGLYAKRGGGDRLVNVRMEEEEAQVTKLVGGSDCRAFATGYRFRLEDYYRPDFNGKEYLLTEIEHEVVPASEGTGIRRDPFSADYRYANRFQCIPYEVPFRPIRKTPKPVVRGAQTAIVTGPSGEEIYTDEHGRVKVQFHWDREGQRDDKSSCWIRVSQLWAGAGWGAMYIPRIGQEVIVDFLEGDPDRPIVTGRVYHGMNKPPYSLPGEKTKSTIKSDSSLGGGGSNEFRFEDKKGSEEIYLHGQKDWTIAIENDKNQTVGHDESLSVGNNRTKTVGVDQSESIGSNKSITVGVNHDEKIGSNKTLNVGANHTESIGANMNLNVGSNRIVMIGANKTETTAIASAETVGAAKALTIGAAYQVSVGGAMNVSVGGLKAEEVGLSKSTVVGGGMSVSVSKDLSEDVGKTHSLKAKKVLIDAEDEITLKSGKASITLKKNGDITIKGKKINVKGSGNVVIKGKKILEN